MLELLVLALGILILVKGADLLVDGAIAIAKALKISDIVIGLTIVSMGTSLPELMVSIFSSLGGNTDILMGNILGSNIANILLVLGSAAIFTKISLKHGTVYNEIPFSLLAVLVFAIMANDTAISGDEFSGVSRSEGLVLLGFFAIFMYYVYGISKNSTDDLSDEHNLPPINKAILYILIGSIMLYFGGDMVVDGAVALASSFGLTKSFVGLTVVAVGTSLPEFVTTLIAAMKKKPDLAVGNVIGSNIFNIFFVLGISALIAPIPYSMNLNLDVLLIISSSILVFWMAAYGKKNLVIGRSEGALLLFMYFAYIVYLLIYSAAA